jgi:hypothetical protein
VRIALMDSSRLRPTEMVMSAGHRQQMSTVGSGIPAPFTMIQTARTTKGFPFGTNFFVSYQEYLVCPYDVDSDQIFDDAIEGWAATIASQFRALSLQSVFAAAGTGRTSVEPECGVDFFELERVLVRALEESGLNSPGVVFDLIIEDGEILHLTGITRPMSLARWCKSNRTWFDGLSIFRMTFEVDQGG